MRHSPLLALLSIVALTGCPDAEQEASCGEFEVPYDAIDNDCDASTPDDDLDGDGVLYGDDCDDTNRAAGGEEA